MALGVYISVPFCRTKCSYCNFASDVFSKSAYENYVARVVEDIGKLGKQAAELECELDENVDSIYLGGGTPSILDNAQLVRIFEAVRDRFTVAREAEITVECAPGTLSAAFIETLLRCGVNRVSLGVQSFVDQEAQAVGRLHKRAIVLEEVSRLRGFGLENINIDLIAGLPHQTAESWTFSLAETIALGAPHVSVYMLEVDEDSRLGRELIAGGTRYHAHFVPDEDATADFYQQACETLNAAGIDQYEISNFARAGKESRHNLKYWTRQPYMGFGVDAHSMLRGHGRLTSAAKAADQCFGATAAVKGLCENPVVPPGLDSLVPLDPALKRGAKLARPAGTRVLPDLSHADAQNRVHTRSLKCCATENQEAVRFSTADSLDAYMNRVPNTVTVVSQQAAIEENFFLGLRLNRGVDLAALSAEFTPDAITTYQSAIDECVGEGLIEKQGTSVRLTSRGRLLSNEVFARFLTDNAKEELKVGTGHVNPR